jgi:hypothetical protein
MWSGVWRGAAAPSLSVSCPSQLLFFFFRAAANSSPLFHLAQPGQGRPGRAHQPRQREARREGHARADLARGPGPPDGQGDH